MNGFQLERYIPYLWSGFGVTLLLAVASIACALPCAVVVLGMSISRRGPWSALARGYTEFMRNTPLVTQLFIIYFGLPAAGIFVPSVPCAVGAIALQHGAFLSDIFRAGLNAVSCRQWDAAASIGMRRTSAFLRIVLPQALIKALPATGNHLTLLVKDTSVAAGIGILDLTLESKRLIDRTAASIEVFLLAAAFYLVLTTLTGLLLKGLEYRYKGRA